MKRKNLWIVVIAVCFVVIIGGVLLKLGRKAGKQEENKSKETVAEETDYSGCGNEQGNIENGGGQTYIKNRGILLKSSDDTNSGMYCFNTESGQLEFYCTKSDCLHSGSECVSNQNLLYLLSYSGKAFGIPSGAKNEIWKCENNELSCIYRIKDDIGGLWGYQGYLYYMTDFGVFRTSISNPGKEEKILDRPVLYEYLTFYNDKLYFCQEDWLLYEANLDGSDKKRFCDQKLVSPQVCGAFLYYRSGEYDAKGAFQMKNTLKRISLKDKSTETIVDAVYQFNVVMAENKIYYTNLPEDQETTLNVLDLKTGKKQKVTKCAAGYLYIFPQSEWIVVEKQDMKKSLSDEEEGGQSTCYYRVKKDGLEEMKLEYPEKIEE